MGSKQLSDKQLRKKLSDKSKQLCDKQLRKKLSDKSKQLSDKTKQLSDKQLRKKLSDKSKQLSDKTKQQLLSDKQLDKRVPGKPLSTASAPRWVCARHPRSKDLGVVHAHFRNNSFFFGKASAN